MTSINLTIHNKARLLPSVLKGIFENTIGPYELIVVFDGCTDSSESSFMGYCDGIKKGMKMPQIIIAKENNVFETKANNTAAKKSKGEHIIIVQDDQIITEHGWNERLLKPFKAFNDVFAVSGRGAHNFAYNHSSPWNNPDYKQGNEWSNLLLTVHHVSMDNTPERNTFFIRDSVYRGPLAINRADLEAMDYFDESFIQDCDDHDLMYRMKAKLGKKVGYYPVGWYSKPEYGGTRDEAGNTKAWVKQLQQKNLRTIYERHLNLMNPPTIEQRELK